MLRFLSWFTPFIPHPEFTPRQSPMPARSTVAFTLGPLEGPQPSWLRSASRRCGGSGALATNHNGFALSQSLNRGGESTNLFMCFCESPGTHSPTSLYVCAPNTFLWPHALRPLLFYQVEVLEYPELGMEAIWKIDVENFPAFIVVDGKGEDFFASLL